MRIPKDVKADIVKRYNAIKKEELDDNVGRIECFKCPDCGKVTKTLVQNKGFVPRGIICPQCGGDAASTQFEDIAPDSPIEYTWNKPKLETVLACHNEPFKCNFYLSGGLERVKKN